MSFDPSDLDSGIRDLVIAMREAGINTTDSGDGVSKPGESSWIDVEHVFAFEDPAIVDYKHRAMHEVVIRERPGEQWTIGLETVPVDGPNGPVVLLFAMREP